MSIQQQRALAQLMEMIRIHSPSAEEKGMVEYLTGYFAARGLQAQCDWCGQKTGGNAGNVLVHIPGQVEGEGICLNAHLDTVEPGRGIVPVVRDGWLVSEGDTILGADDKAGIAAILEAVETAREQKIPHRELYLLFTIGEEKGMNGAKNFDTSSLPCKSILAIDAGGAPGVIAVGGPAQEKLRVTFRGRKAHAGLEPEKGINAICIAARAIDHMKIGRIDEETTCNIGQIAGGAATNIVTDEVFFTGEVRSRNMDKLRAQVAAMEEACRKAAADFGGQVEFESTPSYPPLKLDTDSFIYKKCVAAYEKAGIVPNPINIGGGSDGNILSGAGFDCAIISCGMYDVHTTQEKLNLAEFYATCEMVLALIGE